MPPIIALFLWLVLLLLLFWFDPAEEPGTSVALWVPLTWMFIIATRLPSQWLGGGLRVGGSQAVEAGNPLDRNIFSVLILLAVVMLVLRSFSWGGFVSRNLALMAILSFALVSFVWSDFPLIALKRWFRDLGNYFMILVVLSDPCPLEAVRKLLRRLCYLVIPLSVLLVKYFPEISRHYDLWTGVASIDGATTSKNMLGVACLVSGIFFFWDTLTRWSNRKERRTKQIIALNFAFIAMTLWLLNLADSATSSVCLALGCLVIWAVSSESGKRHTTLIKGMIPAFFCLYLILAFGTNLSGNMASAVGRNPTLTDRTVIWHTVLGLHTNPILGTGYESFWLGPRLDIIWAVAGHINEAHNGYIDIYLNLGAIGVVLLVGFLIASYRTISRRIPSASTLSTLGLAVWTILLFYNMTEAAFKGGLLWTTVLLAGGIAIPGDAGERRMEASRDGIASASNAGKFHRFSVGMARQDR